MNRLMSLTLHALLIVGLLAFACSDNDPPPPKPGEQAEPLPTSLHGKWSVKGTSPTCELDAGAPGDAGDGVDAGDATDAGVVDADVNPDLDASQLDDASTDGDGGTPSDAASGADAADASAGDADAADADAADADAADADAADADAADADAADADAQLPDADASAGDADAADAGVFDAMGMSILDASAMDLVDASVGTSTGGLRAADAPTAIMLATSTDVASSAAVSAFFTARMNDLFAMDSGDAEQEHRTRVLEGLRALFADANEIELDGVKLHVAGAGAARTAIITLRVSTGSGCEAAELYPYLASNGDYFIRSGWELRGFVDSKNPPTQTVALYNEYRTAVVGHDGALFKVTNVRSPNPPYKLYIVYNVPRTGAAFHLYIWNGAENERTSRFVPGALVGADVVQTNGSPFSSY
jgi:hypothetical protein